MGRKPLLSAVGTFLTSLALAGCQTSSTTHPTTGPTYPSNAPVTGQNKTATSPSSSTMTTSTGVPYSPSMQTSVSTQQPSGQFAPYNSTNQPVNQLGQSNSLGRQTSPPTSSAFATPANPTPVAGPQQPLSGPSTMSMGTSLGSSLGSQSLNPAPNVNANVMSVMPASSQALSNSPPPVGVMAPSAPLAPMGGPPMGGMSSNVTVYPSSPSGFATQH